MVSRLTAPDLRARRVDLLCDRTSNTLASIRAGRVRVVGATTTARVSAQPNVPTYQRLGLERWDT